MDLENICMECRQPLYTSCRCYGDTKCSVCNTERYDGHNHTLAEAQQIWRERHNE